MSEDHFQCGMSAARPTGLSYILITPARNEESLIEGTIKCVLNQTMKPLRWVIVSDGSTDRTDDIVREYATQHDWLELVSLPPRAGRQFAAKVHAFNAGYATVQNMKFDVVGNMDADITFEPDLLAFLLNRFAENPRLGIAGAPFTEGGKHYDFRYANVEHISGACLLFRRKCYEQIGGYTPIEVGGEEIFAGLAARMKGWETRTFTEKTYQHHRWGNVRSCGLKHIFLDGYSDFRLGLHPLWEIVRFPYKAAKSPIIIGGIAHISGYCWSMITRASMYVPKELVQYRRAEQMRRLKRILLGIVSRRNEDRTDTKHTYESGNRKKTFI